MAPYTVEGLASREASATPANNPNATAAGAPSTPGPSAPPESPPVSPTTDGGGTGGEETSPVTATPPSTTAKQPTRYTLRGVVVHRGQASAGHYYSYILHYRPETGTYQWYKYDDTAVSYISIHWYYPVASTKCHHT